MNINNESAINIGLREGCNDGVFILRRVNGMEYTINGLPNNGVVGRSVSIHRMVDHEVFSANNTQSVLWYNKLTSPNWKLFRHEKYTHSNLFLQQVWAVAERQGEAVPPVWHYQ